MKKLSESVWMDIHKRSNGDSARKEDPIECAFVKIKEMSLIDVTPSMHIGRKTLWTPCNFGAESYNQPGWWMNRNQIVELHEFLKNTEYCIATEFDWKGLINTYGEVVRINKKNFSLRFGLGEERLYMPNFGYMSTLDYPLFTKKDDSPIFGTILYGKPAYIYLKFNRTKSDVLRTLEIESHMCTNLTDEKFQVRLVKRVS